MDILTYINKMNRLYGSEQQVASLAYGTQDTYGAPEETPMPNWRDLIREEGIQVGPQVKAPRNEKQVAGLSESFPGTYTSYQDAVYEGFQGTREEWLQQQSIPQIDRPFTGQAGGRVYDTRKYFKPGGLVEPGVTHYAKIGPHGEGKFEVNYSKTQIDKAVKYYSKGKYLTFSEIPLGEKTKQLRTNIRTHISTHEGKFVKPTTFDALSKTNQEKILKVFPDAKFGPGRKFGFSKATEKKLYDNVKDFVERDYKVSLIKKLPVPVRNDIMKTFSHIPAKDWDFDKYKFGLADTKVGGKNAQNAVKIKTFINDPKPFKYAFRLEHADGWMLQQMDRAYMYGDTRYTPICDKIKCGKNSKIVGFTDNTKYGEGKKYFANENLRKEYGKGSDRLISKHTDFANTKKFISIANEAKAKPSKALLSMFPEGFDTSRLKLNHLVSYLVKEKGAGQTRRAIEIHHTKGVTGRATGGYQLLTRDLNIMANTIGEEIKAGNFKNIESLKANNIRIVVDGKAYGAPTESARAGMKRIVSNVEKEVATWGAKEFKSFDSFQNGIFDQAKKAGIGPNCGKKQDGGSYAKCMQNAIDNEVKLAKSGGKGAKTAAQKLTGLGKWAGKWFGLIDIPFEFAFALPSLVRGDIEGAKQSTTFGLLGWGKTELEQMQERNPEAYKYMKHYDDTMNHFQLQWQKNDLEKKLEGFKTTGTYGQDVKNKMTGQLQSINEQLQSIQDNYIGYETPDAMHSGYEALQKDIGVEGAKRQKDAWSVVKREDVDLPDNVAGHFMKQNLERSRGRWQTDPIIERLGLERDFILPDKPGLSPVELAGRYGRKNLMDYYGSQDMNRGNIDPGVPFSKGGSVDKARRAFLKMIAALTGTAAVGATGLLKIVKGSKGVTTIKAGDHIIQGTPGMPDWFIPLVNRITKEGTDVTKKLGTVEREIVHTKKINQFDEVTVYQNMDTGNVRVEYGPPPLDKKGNVIRASNDMETVHLEYKAPEVIESGKYRGQKTKSEFSAAESEPEVVNWDGDIEWSGINEVNTVDDLVTPTHKLKEFGQKKLTHRDKVIAKKKQKYKNKLESDTMEQIDYIENKRGPFEDPQSIDDILEQGKAEGVFDPKGYDTHGNWKGQNLPKEYNEKVIKEFVEKTKKASGGRVDYDNYLPDIEDID